VVEGRGGMIHVEEGDMDSLANIVSKLEMLFGGEKGRCFAYNQTPGYNTGVAVERLNGIYNRRIEKMKNTVKEEQSKAFVKGCGVDLGLEQRNVLREHHTQLIEELQGKLKMKADLSLENELLRKELKAANDHIVGLDRKIEHIVHDDAHNIEDLRNHLERETLENKSLARRLVERAKEVDELTRQNDDLRGMLASQTEELYALGGLVAGKTDLVAELQQKLETAVDGWKTRFLETSELIGLILGTADRLFPGLVVYKGNSSDLWSMSNDICVSLEKVAEHIKTLEGQKERG